MPDDKNAEPRPTSAGGGPAGSGGTGASGVDREGGAVSLGAQAKGLRGDETPDAAILSGRGEGATGANTGSRDTAEPKSFESGETGAAPEGLSAGTAGQGGTGTRLSGAGDRPKLPGDALHK